MQQQQGMTDKQLASNAGKLVIAGSETTATLLAGTTYFLMKDRDALARATCEVRTTFQSESEINFTSVNKLSYMVACLDEALRLYPPVATGLPRVVPKGGGTVSGTFIPENVWNSLPYLTYLDVSRAKSADYK